MKKQFLGLIVGSMAFAVGVAAERIYVSKTPAADVLPTVEKAESARLAVLRPTEVNTERPDDSNAAVARVESEDQYIYGWYSLKNYGKKMPEVEMIKLYGDNEGENGERLKKVVLSAGIYTSLSDDIEKGFAEEDWTRFDGRNVSFKTKKLKGIVYSFEGSFFKGKTSGDEGEAVLRGTLRKYVKGKKVAEVSGDFFYNEPYCLN